MVLTPLAIFAGLVLGLLRGGRFGALRSAQVRLWPLVLLGIALQTSEQWGAFPGRLAVFIVGLLLLILCTMNNVHLKGSVITGFGLTLNVIAVLLNGYIPLRVEALQAVGGIPVGADPSGYAVNGLWRFEDSGTSVRQLGDIVPIPVIDDVISFGDLIMLGGIIVLTMNLLLRQPRRRLAVDQLFPEDAPLDLRESIELSPEPEESRHMKTVT